MVQYFTCRECNKKIIKDQYNRIYCIPCSYIRKKKNTKLDYDILLCHICKTEFRPNSATHKICTKDCLEKSIIKQRNEKWGNTEYKEPPRKDGDKVAYSFFRIKKNQGWMKKYKVMSG